MSVFLELLSFLAQRKKLWLAPVIVVMGLIGAVLAFSQGTVFAPFIYALF